jgi:hypothetical protein
VKQISGGRLEKVGLAADDPLPDVTKLAALFREYFGPTVPLEVVEDRTDTRSRPREAAIAWHGRRPMASGNAVSF